MRMTKKVATVVCRWRTRQLGTAWHSIGFESESGCNVFVPSMWYGCCCWNSNNVYLCVCERDSAKVSLSRWNRLRRNCVCAPVCCGVYVDNFLDFHISVAVVHKLIIISMELLSPFGKRNCRVHRFAGIRQTKPRERKYWLLNQSVTVINGKYVGKPFGAFAENAILAISSWAHCTALRPNGMNARPSECPGSETERRGRPGTGRSPNGYVGNFITMCMTNHWMVKVSFRPIATCKIGLAGEGMIGGEAKR